MSTPRLLAIMGSGETTPTMAKTHRQLFERLGPPPVPAVVVGTPYGFQMNAADISSRTVGYFQESVGRQVAVASLARLDGADPVEVESDLAAIAQAKWVFAGPGSPTYSLRQWRASPVPSLLAEKLAHGGCLVFASAAALTLGRWSVPVYEIYKVGEDPHWVEGLDLLSPFGLVVAVVPHFDNAEGGTHDTRYCYLGEQRLREMERRLPPEGWVLGVDEHTALILDLGAGTATVSGRGAVTLRHREAQAVLAAGETVAIGDLPRLAAGGRRPGSPGDRPVTPPVGGQPGGPPPGAAPPAARSPLLEEVHRLEGVFQAALERRDATAATAAVLDLEATLHQWAADTFQSDELDRGRAALRQMVARLGQAAGPGLSDPAAVAAPWVEALLGEREEARRERRFDDADRIRQRLSGLGVEVRDTPDGTEWLLPAHQ